MMNNVNLSLAVFSVLFRKVIEKFRNSQMTITPNRPFWQKQILYMAPCAYMCMFCVGLYYTYKQVDQKKSLLSLPRKCSRFTNIKENAKRKKFIERNKMWFLRNLANGAKGREEVLKVLYDLPAPGEKIRNKSSMRESDCLPQHLLLNDDSDLINNNFSSTSLNTINTQIVPSAMYMPIVNAINSNCNTTTSDGRGNEGNYEMLPAYKKFDHNFHSDDNSHINNENSNMNQVTKSTYAITKSKSDTQVSRVKKQPKKRGRKRKMKPEENFEKIEKAEKHEMAVKMRKPRKVAKIVKPPRAPKTPKMPNKRKTNMETNERNALNFVKRTRSGRIYGYAAQNLN